MQAALLGLVLCLHHYGAVVVMIVVDVVVVMVFATADQHGPYKRRTAGGAFVIDSPSVTEAMTRVNSMADQ